jgi:hypothetical protein
VLLRLFGFRPTIPGEMTDRCIRESIEAGLIEKGATRVYSGRGTDGRGELRRVVSVWPDDLEGTLAEALGDVMSFEASIDAAERSISVLPLRLTLAFDDEAPATILRVFHGRTRPDDLESYIADANAGTIADAEAQRGPLALFLAVDPPDRFVTVSAWADWDRVSEATGGNLRAPIATRHTERLVEWGASHYEIIPHSKAGQVAT